MCQLQELCHCCLLRTHRLIALDGQPAPSAIGSPELVLLLLREDLAIYPVVEVLATQELEDSAGTLHYQALNKHLGLLRSSRC
jgi:hypothetical protein